MATGKPFLLVQLVYVQGQYCKLFQFHWREYQQAKNINLAVGLLMSVLLDIMDLHNNCVLCIWYLPIFTKNVFGAINYPEGQRL